MKAKQTAKALSLTLAVYGLVGFLYIAGNAWFHPESLSWPLTHFLPYPREDTSGIVSFFVSLISFFVYRLLSESDTSRKVDS